jgi:hypothetical protein
VIFLVNKKRVKGFTFVELKGNVCPLDTAINCDFVGSCDVIIGLNSPCVRVSNS